MPPKISHKKSSKAFNDFICGFKIKPDERETTTPTHQRIGNKELGIYGGSYCIPDEKMDEFNKLYYESIIVNGNKEYLTERQLKNDQSPILVDLDLKYNPEIIGRQHTDDDIMTIIETFLMEIKKCVELDETPFPVYVFHKENINKSSDECTKDGIHIIFGIQMNHDVQAILRNGIIKTLPDKLDLQCINKWENIIDNAISSGSSPWQLYGSRKPGFEAYKIDKYCLFQYKNDEFSLEECKSNNEIRMNLDLFTKICARYKNNTVFPIKEDVLNESMKKNKPNTSIKNNITNYQITKSTEEIKVSELTSVEILDTILAKQFSSENLTSTDYDKMKATHEYLMILPEEYYTDYEKWIRVGWALRNTDEKLFVSWIKFSSQWEHFNFNDVDKLYNDWYNTYKTGPGQKTHRSIATWAKHHWNKFSEENNVENKYETIKNNTLEYYVEEALKTKYDYDIAKVVYQLYKDKYICTNISKNQWYVFDFHRWRPIDSACSLRLELSQHMYDVFQAKSFETTNIMAQYDNDDSRWTDLQKKTLNILEILGKLKDSKKKANIMSEAKDLFHQVDDNFHQRTDDNPYLLGFINGVIDFDQKTFRPGVPDDFITKTTGLAYIEPRDYDQTIVDEINDYFDKIFPNKNIRSYMWDSLASSLIGKNFDAAFNICIGSGSNGKSALMSFMKICLGDYYGQIPTEYLTAKKRPATGSVQPEIAVLRGVRFVTCDEPNPGERLNTGIMKSITGGDEVNARNLYEKGNFRFKPQFKIFPCTNEFFIIESKDDGTWRRIKVVPFESKFVKKIDKNSGVPNQVVGIKHLEKKYEKWKETFISMLVQRAFETEGSVDDCEEVIAQSKEYKLDQDPIKEFINTKITTCEGEYLKKKNINEEFKNWYEETYGPKYNKNMKDLSAAMDKQYGKYNLSTGWANVKIIYDDSIYDNDVI